MKSKIKSRVFIWGFVFQISLCLGNEGHAKFDTAMVFSGGSLQVALFLGMLEGAQSLGVKPDLIIGSCGGSFAAAIAQVIPTHEERLRFIQSSEFQEYLRSPEPTQYAETMSFLKLLAGVNYRRYISDLLPPLFDQFMFYVPLNTSFPGFNQHFAEDRGVRVIMVATRLGFGPKAVEEGGVYGSSKPFQEVFFTDAGVAPLLENFQSPIAALYPESAVQLSTDVLLGHSLDAAARASIADPYLINPAKIGEEYFMTGALDLYPIEVARTVAHHVIMTYEEDYGSIVEIPIMAGTMRYPSNDRLHQVQDQFATYWIDRSDASQIRDQIGFIPGLHDGKISLGVPADRQDYRTRTQAQWDLGKARAIEAIQGKGYNDQSHIRNPSHERLTEGQGPTS